MDDRPMFRGWGRAVWVAAGLLIVAATPGPARAYPDKPIRLVVPSPPGGGTDTLARLVANKLTETLKWVFVPDNKPGAGGNIGMDAVAKAAPDGYTIGMGESSNLTINPYLYAKMPYDVAKDLAPVVLVGTVPLVLVSAPARQFPSIEAIVAAARSKPLTFASGGNGTVGHLAGELWMRQAAIALQHIPYRGGAQAIADVVSAQVDIHFASIPAAASFIEAGTVKAFAVTAPGRSPQLPGVPTMDEAGYKVFSAQVLYGVVTPAATPSAIVETLNAAINRALQSEDVRARLTRIGVEGRGGTPAEFGAFLEVERAKWSRTVVESGARVD